MTYEARKTFTDSLGTLTKTEYENIYRILKNSGENYSENCNGIFFDVAGLKDDTFNKLNEYLKLCIVVRESDKNRIDQMNIYKSEMRTPVDT